MDNKPDPPSPPDLSDKSTTKLGTPPHTDSQSSVKPLPKDLKDTDLTDTELLLNLDLPSPPDKSEDTDTLHTEDMVMDPLLLLDTLAPPDTKDLHTDLTDTELLLNLDTPPPPDKPDLMDILPLMDTQLFTKF